jgi:hypothetical protein
MKTIKIYLLTAGILLAGAGISSAQETLKEKIKAKKEAAKAKAETKKKGKADDKGQNDIAVKKQGNPTTGKADAAATSTTGNK